MGKTALEKKKILFVIHQLTVGGSQKSLVSSLNAIDYEKNEVTLYVRKNRLDLLDSINPNVKILVNDDKHHYYRKPYAITYLLAIKLYKALGKNTREAHYSNLLTTRTHDDMLSYEYNKFFKNQKYDVAISYISNWHCRLVAEYIDAKKKICFHFDSKDFSPEIHKKAFPCFNQIVVDSNGTKDNLVKNYIDLKDRFIVVNNYIDYDNVIIKSKEKTDVNHSHKFIIASCGRLTNIKGFDLAVMAASILKSKEYDFIWYFVGDGPERSRIENMIIEQNLKDNIVITGMVDNPFPYIKACNIYVQPSYDESYGLTITEAKMLNKPVVSTRTAGGKEQIENGVNGILTDITPTAIADGIILLLKNPKKVEEIERRLGAIDYSNKFEEYKSIWERLIQV